MGLVIHVLGFHIPPSNALALPGFISTNFAQYFSLYSPLSFLQWNGEKKQKKKQARVGTFSKGRKTTLVLGSDHVFDDKHKKCGLITILHGFTRFGSHDTGII